MAQMKTRRDSTEPLLTVREVAQLNRISEKTVRRAIACGELDVLRIGPGNRVIRIEPAAHRAWRNRSRA